MIECNDPALFRESAETLRYKRPINFSFPKASRFMFNKKQDDRQYVMLPSTLNRRGTSLGYGQRWQPDVHTKDIPSPGTYEVRTSMHTSHGPRYKDATPKFLEGFDGVPGPGSYDFVQPIGKNAPKLSFRSKHYDIKYSCSPSPQAYSPKISQGTAIKGTTFGYGQREFMRNMKNDSPGPGCYEFSSTFSKHKTKNKT